MRKTREPLVWVIRDSRNGRRDYQLPLSRAQELHAAGLLVWCLTNRTYATLAGEYVA
jgi:hypothetical protein